MTTHKLDDLQLIMLSAASQHQDGSLIPLPAAAASDLARAAKTIAALIRKSLAEEIPVTDRRLAWRDADQDPTGVFITAAGREAIGVGGGSADTDTDPAVAAAVESVGVTAGAGTSATALQQRRAGSKNDLVLEMLRRDGGATITELVAATNWLPHTTRAVLTGLRKKGNSIRRGKRDDVTCYTIEVAA